jgi:hypothetical protein
MNLVGRSAFSGAIGGLAGGFAGQYITADPVLTSMIGGGIGGGIEGSYRGNWMQGAMAGAYSGMWSSALTTVAYQKYGEYLANKIEPDSYGKDIAPNANEEYMCRNFREDLVNHLEGDIDMALFGKMPNSREAAHEGVVLGRNKYGQHFIISKEGVSGGIFVRTSTYLTNMYGKPFQVMYMPSYNKIPTFLKQ